MERKTNAPERKTRHTVVFSADEVKRILNEAARVAGKGLPAEASFIWFPDSRRSGTPQKVTIGVDI